MPTDIAFRLSTYITLALACATLGYSEWDLLPEASICSFIVGGLMILTFSQEGKWELSLTAANRLGLVIGIMATAWIAFQIVRPSGGLIYKLPWPASLLPYIGPLVMVLMPAKLFRPKHVGDWWTMHGVGLAAVALACTLADDLTHGILVGLYLVCGAWSMSLFFLRRAAGGVPLIPGQELRQPRSLVVTGDFSSAPKTLLGRAFAARPLWALASAASFGTLLFFITPRIDGPSWNLTTLREVGYNAEDSAPDLNRGGSLTTANRDIAFIATIRNADGTPKTDIPSDQLWRGRSYAEYLNGKWQPQSTMKPLVLQSARQANLSEPLTGDMWTAEIEWKSKRRDAVIASPVQWKIDHIPPVTSETPYGRIAWSQTPDGFFFPVTRDSFAKYRQVNQDAVEIGLGSFFEMTRFTDPRLFDVDPYRDIDALTRCDLPAVRDYARSLLRQFVEQGKMPSGILQRLDPVSRTVSVDDHEMVAALLRRHLADSGEFSYDTQTSSGPKDRDPIENFLFVSKTGTCERFATALAQILRALGIPARIVVGFKGCEQEDDGKYIIRQEHAHAWCEIIIRRPTPAGFPTVNNSKHVFAWLNLDPTPGDEMTNAAANGIASQVRSFWQSIGDFFSSFVSKYNPEQRDRLWRISLGGLRRWWPIVLELVAVLFISIAIWRLIQNARLRKIKPVKSEIGVPDWYSSFLEFAAKRGFDRLMVETPAEHARRFANSLPVGLTDHPIRLATAMSAYRYGSIEPDLVMVHRYLSELEQS